MVADPIVSSMLCSLFVIYIVGLIIISPELFIYTRLVWCIDWIRIEVHDCLCNRYPGRPEQREPCCNLYYIDDVFHCSSNLMHISYVLLLYHND